MLELNNNFDDDLMQDVIEMIDHSKWRNLLRSYDVLNYIYQITWMNEILRYLIFILIYKQ